MGSAAFLVEACRQLGDELSKAWHSHSEAPSIPPDEDEALYAQRLIAQRCLYGLDKNPMAADLAKLSLWLATLAKDHPFTFLDHSLRHGDALVGLTRKQIASFNWEPAEQKSFLEEDIRKRIDRATQYRERILDARDNVPYAQLSQELSSADEALNLPRMVGDAVIAAFFLEDKPKKREELRRKMQSLIEADLKKEGFISMGGEPDSAIQRLRKGSKGIVPFHWELEFPEVFTGDDKGQVIGGFDVIVGNPPFAGKNTLIDAHAEGYLPWLQMLHSESHGNSDLVAHFFRRAFALLRSEGCFGLIATNTIGQGDTRSTGLRWICMNGGTIYRARKRLKWPGQAAVVVSVVHLLKGTVGGPFLLDGREVPIITAYLFHAGTHEDARPLKANHDRAFVGNFVLGIGFTFDDEDRSGKANTIEKMNALIKSDIRNSQRIFPYINGEELNAESVPTPKRYIINFGSMSEQEARKWPDLFHLVEEKVKPDRLKQGSIVNPERWWMFARSAADLYRAIEGMSRVIVRSLTSTNFPTFTFLPHGLVYDQALIVFAFDHFAALAVLCARTHESWAIFQGATMKDDPRYNVQGCFETFPFPADFATRESLEQTGQEYFNWRAAIMVSNNEGLTETYNRFHDPDEQDPNISRLRELHASVDRVVLDAYGWNDIQPKCEFIPVFEDEDEEEEGRERKKKYRYRWSDEVRDDVLARLLELNRQRTLEEGQVVMDEKVAALDAKLKDPSKGKRNTKKTKQGSTSGLFAMDQEEA